MWPPVDRARMKSNVATQPVEPKKKEMERGNSSKRPKNGSTEKRSNKKDRNEPSEGEKYAKLTEVVTKTNVKW